MEIDNKFFKTKPLFILFLTMTIELAFVTMFFIRMIYKENLMNYEGLLIFVGIMFQIIYESSIVVKYKKAMKDLENFTYNKNVKYRIYVLGRSFSILRFFTILITASFLNYFPLLVVYIISMFVWYFMKYLENRIVKYVLLKKKFDKKKLKIITPAIFAGIVITRIVTQLYNKLVLSKRPAYLRYEETSLEMYIVVSILILTLILIIVGLFQVTKYFSGKNADKRLYLLKISEDEQLYNDTYVKWKEEKNE